MIFDAWTARENFKRLKVFMKRFSKELEVSGWDGFKPNDDFNDEIIRWEIEIDFRPMVSCGYKKLSTPFNLADIMKSQ